jgi:hypothetical protein
MAALIQQRDRMKTARDSLLQISSRSFSDFRLLSERLAIAK